MISVWPQTVFVVEFWCSGASGVGGVLLQRWWGAAGALLLRFLIRQVQVLSQEIGTPKKGEPFKPKTATKFQSLEMRIRPEGVLVTP